MRYLSSNCIVNLKGKIPLFLLFSFVSLLVLTVVVLFVVGYSTVFLWCEQFAKATATQNPLLHIIVAPLCFVVGAGLCWKFAPHALGNGVSKVRIGLELLHEDTKQIKPYFGTKLVLIKTVGSWLCALGGGALGREGPVVHMSAALFWIFGQRLKRIFPHLDLKHWIIAGSAAGFAIAFHTPIAGLIFAVEELSDDYLTRRKLMTLWMVLFACLIHQFIMPVAPLFAFFMQSTAWFDLLPEIIITTVLCGILSAVLMLTSNKVQQHIQRKYPFWVIALLCGLMVGIIGVLLGEQSFSGGVTTIQNAVQSSTSVIHLPQLLGRLVNTFLSIFSGNAGGLLGPSLALGASIGSVVGDLFGLIDVRILMLCGMAAFLGGLMSIPLTAAIVVFETTGQSPLLLALYISGMLGHLSSRAVRKLLKSNKDE
jgi:H+/Cl- antiporter ClcA